MAYLGTNEQLANALGHIADRASSGATDRAVCAEAAVQLRAMTTISRRLVRLTLEECPFREGTRSAAAWRRSLRDAVAEILTQGVAEDQQ